MSKKKGEIERKSRRSGVGTLFLGFFLGFILCLGTIGGLGCFVYFKVSPNWLNKTFKTKIDLGNEDVNSKTLKDFVNGALGLIQNVDTYTLNDLKGDFGIEVKDELFGIDVSDLKKVALIDLGSEIEHKFATISAGELKEVKGMNLTSMSNILDKHNTYYFNENNNKLYKQFDGSSYSNEVNFSYKVSQDKTKVTTKGVEQPIVAGEVKISLWNLPLTSALSDFTAHMGDQITLAELEADYGVELPSFFNNVDKSNTTVNELEEEINKLYVADFLGYTIDNSDPDNVTVWNGSTKVEGVVATLAKLTISGLEEGIDGLKLKDVFSTDDLNSGALSLINKETAISELADELSRALETKTIDELITAGLIDNPNGYNQTTKVNWINVGNDTYKQVKDLLLQDVVNVLFENIDISTLPNTNPNA